MTHYMYDGKPQEKPSRFQSWFQMADDEAKWKTVLLAIPRMALMFIGISRDANNGKNPFM